LLAWWREVLETKRGSSLRAQRSNPVDNVPTWTSPCGLLAMTSSYLISGTSEPGHQSRFRPNWHAVIAGTASRDEAISTDRASAARDCFAPLAMTIGVSSVTFKADLAAHTATGRSAHGRYRQLAVFSERGLRRRAVEHHYVGFRQDTLPRLVARANTGALFPALLIDTIACSTSLRTDWGQDRPFGIPGNRTSQAGALQRVLL